MEFHDALTLDSPRRTADGYLVASVRAARTGIQEYAGSEVGKPDMKIVRVYRPADEVFSKDAMASFTSIPVTVDHPPVAVTADTWREHAVGNTGEDIARDGEFIRVPLIVKDASAIRQIEAGKRELSMGYTTELKWDAGTFNGMAYDAVQTSLRGNHLAIVGRARGGDKLRIGDSSMDPLKIVRDGVTIEVNDAFIASLDKKITTLTADIAKLTADHATALATKDTELAKRDAEIDGLKAKVLDASALDAAVTKRADLIATAKAIHDADYTGKTEIDIRKAVLTAKGIAFDGKSDAYIDARFDVLAEDAKSAGRVVNAIASGAKTPTGFSQQTVDAAAAKSVVDMNAWRNQA